jgi:hypothetical protein
MMLHFAMTQTQTAILRISGTTSKTPVKSLLQRQLNTGESELRRPLANKSRSPWLLKPEFSFASNPPGLKCPYVQNPLHHVHANVPLIAAPFIRIPRKGFSQ